MPAYRAVRVRPAVKHSLSSGKVVPSSHSLSFTFISVYLARNIIMGSTGSPPNHALVFGATGIQGWAVINQLLEGYPSPNAFSRVTALANRPPTENLLWPNSDKLQIVSGINLLNEGGQEALNEQLRKQVPEVKSVTHVFFFGQTQSSSRRAVAG